MKATFSSLNFYVNNALLESASFMPCVYGTMYTKILANTVLKSINYGHFNLS